MRKFTKSFAAMLSLTMVLSAGTPVFAEEEGALPSQNTEVTTNPEPTVSPEPTVTPEPTVSPEPTVTPEPTVAPQPPKNGLFTDASGKTYYYQKGKIVKNKYGIKIKGKYYRISKKGIVTQVSTAEGLAGIRLQKCGGDLKKAFKWSSTKIQYGNVGKPKKGQNEIEYYATYGFKKGRGDCYVMAATFCMMAKVKGNKNVYMVKGKVPQANGKSGAHGWCEIKNGKKTYVYDPNFAYTYRNSSVKHHSGYKFTYSMLGKGYGLYRYNLKNIKRIKA